jgi:hypothetical protein
MRTGMKEDSMKFGQKGDSPRLLLRKENYAIAHHIAEQQLFTLPFLCSKLAFPSLRLLRSVVSYAVPHPPSLAEDRLADAASCIGPATLR